MSTTTTPDQNSTRGRGIPRWVFVLLGLFTWLVGVPLAHSALPWALSWLAPRYGWTAGYPGTWNWLGSPDGWGGLDADQRSLGGLNVFWFGRTLMFVPLLEPRYNERAPPTADILLTRQSDVDRLRARSGAEVVTWPARAAAAPPVLGRACVPPLPRGSR